MKVPYPLSIEDQRSYPEGFDGRVFVWDIDKTYLETHFSSLKGMARIPVEFAIDKKAIAGMPEILRGLRRGPGEDYACAPLYFVSASPPQMRRVIERKMLMDGVEYDGIILKDWLKTLRRLRPGRLREQAGFKVCALLAGRQNRPRSTEYLFGDDVESDAAAANDPSLGRREILERLCDEVVKKARSDLDRAESLARAAEALADDSEDPYCRALGQKAVGHTCYLAGRYKFKGR